MLREDRYAQLIEVASRIVVEDGIGALTMEGLATKAKISKPVVYSHFVDRNDLLGQLIQAYWREHDAYVPSEPEPGENIADFTRRSTDAHFEFVTSRSHPIRQLIRRSFDDPAIAHIVAQRENEVVAQLATFAVEHGGLNETEAQAAATVSLGALRAASVAAAADPARTETLKAAYIAVSDRLLRLN
ncbi:TetR/AcrR family transcriptional regulator [Parasphingopyxis sp.]|uniref:TetR/AcrR family transcriptional regulator n=1 Tax=Parasphingopyxis sp. TaxID=1920299 RepID=UPI00261344BC|nr:TetR/AcrR family transcriptional regulator [Parasphingopyxis sp.]